MFYLFIDFPVSKISEERVFQLWIFKFSFVSFRFRRQTHVTPKSYLSFLDGYLKLYQQKLDEIGELAGRMNTGLEKLIEASASVDVLSKELVVKEKDLAVANVKADKVNTF